MKLKLPKIKKKTGPSKPSARNIAKTFIKGAKARKKRSRETGGPGGYGAGYGALPIPITQKLDVELKEKEKRGLLDEEKLKTGVALPTGKEISLSAKFRMPTDTAEMHAVNVKYLLIPPSPKQG